MPSLRRRRLGARSQLALAALVSVSALQCAGATLASLPTPTTAATMASSSSSSTAAPLAPPTLTMEADFVIDSSTTVNASVSDIHTMLLAEGSLTHVLPYTRRASLVGEAQGTERHVRLVQGTSLINVEYTLHIEDCGAVVRFTLEKAHPHGIEDCQGFFELTAEAPDRTRVRFVDAVDLGKGVARYLFKEQIRKSALTTPTLVQKYMETGQPGQAPPPNGNELGTVAVAHDSDSGASGRTFGGEVSLSWDDLGGGYSAFLELLFTGDLDHFFAQQLGGQDQ